ncbi:unnamed protein product [Staurois parvus]|uniref:Uncharacterized protein n=1 Tax=Staurois parvus TaxID=386267 RepID=A0ABN9DTK8_9NEOB|nr:unnamed protein product [Staurois parvus]
MDILTFPGRKNSKNAGRAQDKALGTKLRLNGLIVQCIVCMSCFYFF